MRDKKRIKIGYFADGPWSHEAFKLLQNDSSINIEFIVPRNDTKDNTLKNYANEYNIPYLYPIKINSEEFYKQALDFSCDLFVSMSFNQIFKSKIINLPPLKSINCHAGLLPFYRGRNVLNWALINDEKEYGITVHYIDEGIDTGDIILQRRYGISEKDSYRTLLERAYKDCANILYDAIKQIQNGSVKTIKQDSIHPIGSYCGIRGEGDEIINWNQSSREVFNFIRALDLPGPQAITFLHGNIIKINKAKMIQNAPTYKGTAGQVLLKKEKGYIVKTKNSFIEINEISSNVKIKIGDKFKNEK